MPKPKTLLTFIGPSHHIQLIRPIEQELTSRGWHCTRYTASTEACFQVGLHTYYPTSPYFWLPDYYDESKYTAMYNRILPTFQHLYSQQNELHYIHPVTLDRLVHSICQEASGTDNLILSTRPTVTLALHEINRWGRLLGYYSSLNKIPFYTLQEGLYYGDPLLYEGHTHYSHSFVWGDATRSILLQAGASPERISVVGHPDLWSRKKAAQKHTLSHLPPEAKGKKIVFLFFSNISLTLTPEIMEGWNDQSDYYLVVRHHQLASLPYITHLKEFFSAYPNVLFSTDMPNEEPLPHWPLMEAAHLCLIFGTSSLTAEWLSRIRPLGVFVSPLDHLRDYTKDPPIALNCSNLSFLQAIKKVDHEWAPSHTARAQEWFNSEISTRTDAAPRIADYIESHL